MLPYHLANPESPGTTDCVLRDQDEGQGQGQDQGNSSGMAPPTTPKTTPEVSSLLQRFSKELIGAMIVFKHG